MTYWKIIKKTVSEFIEDDVMTYSASIAFYTIFSLPAIVIIAMTIAGALYSDEAVRNMLLNQITMLSGSENAKIVQKFMANAQELGTSPIANIVGIGTLLFSATTVFNSLQKTLNIIWKIEPPSSVNILHSITDRLFSLAVVIGMGVLLLLSLIIDTVLVTFNEILSQTLSSGGFYLVTIFNVIVSLFITAVVFALIFKFLPDKHLHWNDVWIGALSSTFLFTLGKYLISIYLGNSTLSSAYGAAGSLVILLLWIYYSTIILLLGAEFAYVYSEYEEPTPDG